MAADRKLQIPRKCTMTALSARPWSALATYFLNMVSGKIRLHDPVHRLLASSFIRLTDHAAVAYEGARKQLLEITRRKAGQRLALVLSAVSHFEDCVSTLSRANNFASALNGATDHAYRQFVIPPEDADQLRLFRNRIQHSDEDIIKGRSDSAIIWVRDDSIALAGYVLTFSGLAACIEGLNEMAHEIASNGVSFDAQADNGDKG